MTPWRLIERMNDPTTFPAAWKMIVMPTDEELMIAKDTVATLGL